MLFTEMEGEAAGLYYCLKITRLWMQVGYVSEARLKEMVGEEQVVEGLYRASLAAIGTAFGMGQAEASRIRIEAECVLAPDECPPSQQWLF